MATEIFNLPADLCEFTVARYVNGEWWFWGTWDDEADAYSAAHNVDGEVFERKEVLYA